MTNKNMQHEIVNICNQLLKGEMTISVAARELRDYRDNFEIKNYDDILLFDKIASKIEHFPLGDERQHWNEKRLKEKDKEREEIELHYKEKVHEACERLIEEFS